MFSSALKHPASLKHHKYCNCMYILSRSPYRSDLMHILVLFRPQTCPVMTFPCEAFCSSVQPCPILGTPTSSLSASFCQSRPPHMPTPPLTCLYLGTLGGGTAHCPTLAPAEPGQVHRIPLSPSSLSPSALGERNSPLPALYL